jgi:hypothetical protein
MSEETKQRESMTREDAERKLREWGELLEVDTERDFFKDVLDELVKPVMLGRLDFDAQTGAFAYMLIKPIQHTNSSKELITISEGNFGANKVADRFKENQKVEQSSALIARRTGLLSAEVEQLSDRDISRINAVILGFFGQTKSSR